jgi:hypothetical protein
MRRHHLLAALILFTVGAAVPSAFAPSSPLPVSPPASGAIALAAGNTFTCALTAAGGVKCWGYNYYGQR